MKRKYEKPQIISEKMELNLLCGTCTLAHNITKPDAFAIPPCHATCARPIANASPV
jgi:hypothetical protein